MKAIVVKALAGLEDLFGFSEEKISDLTEIPKDPKLGDYAFPCFILAKEMKKSPVDIAAELASRRISILEGVRFGHNPFYVAI